MLAIAAAALLFLVLVEIALRIAAPFDAESPRLPDEGGAGAATVAWFVADPSVGWRFAPGAEIADGTQDDAVRYRCNALGFRRNEPYDALGAARTVVFLGAESVFGVGVAEDETLVAHVSRAIAPARVESFAMPGFGVDQMWCALRAFALAKRPTLVVAVFTDDELTRSTTASGGRDGWPEKPAFALERGQLVPRERSSALARWLESSLCLSELARRADRQLGRDQGWGGRWALNRALFAALRDDCLAAGARLCVVHLPQAALWRAFPAYARDFRRLGVDFLDLGAVPVEDASELYFPSERHLDRDGHAVAGREIARFLSEQGFAEARLR